MEGETQFKHSIKVPMQYKKAAKVLKNSMETNASVKGQIFAEKHAVNTTLLRQFPCEFSQSSNILPKCMINL